MRKTSKKTDKKTIRKIPKGKKVTYQRGTKWYSCKKQKLNSNIKISKQSSKNKKKNKKNMLGGALVSPGDLKNSTVIIYDKNKHFTCSTCTLEVQ